MIAIAICRGNHPFEILNVVVAQDREEAFKLMNEWERKTYDEAVADGEDPGEFEPIVDEQQDVIGELMFGDSDLYSGDQYQLFPA